MNGLMRLGRKVRAVWSLLRGRGITDHLFDLYYLVKRDPWSCESSALEQDKYLEILSLLPPSGLQSALEIGCAEGTFTSMLAQRVEKLLAVDVSSIALQRARQAAGHLPNVDFREVNIRDQQLEGNYDLIMAGEILYYMGTPDEIAVVGKKMVDWLKIGGHLLLCHMRSQFDEAEGFPVPRWTPSHPGAHTVHGIFDRFAELERVREIVHPLYKVSLYRRL